MQKAACNPLRQGSRSDRYPGVGITLPVLIETGCARQKATHKALKPKGQTRAFRSEYLMLCFITALLRPLPSKRPAPLSKKGAPSSRECANVVPAALNSHHHNSGSLWSQLNCLDQLNLFNCNAVVPVHLFHGHRNLFLG